MKKEIQWELCEDGETGEQCLYIPLSTKDKKLARIIAEKIIKQLNEKPKPIRR